MSETGRTKWGTKIVLVVLAAACGGVAWYANGQQPTVGARAEADATTTAATYISEDLTRALKHWAPGDDPVKLQNQLQLVVLRDSDVTAVRVFDAEGALVFSTVAGDAEAADLSIVQAALTGGASVDDSDDTTLRTYATAGELVGEIDQDAAEIRGVATLPWTVAQFGGIAIAIVLLGAAMFAGNGTKAPKARAPKVEDAPAKQTKKELANADPEMEKLRAKADKAEHSRRALEDQLNVLRSQILSGDAGSQARISELEGHLQDAHNRVTDAETRAAELTQKVAELEAAASGSGPEQQRAAALEAEIHTSKARVLELEGLVKTVEQRAAQAETTAAAHTGQLDEAHVKTQQAETLVQDAVDRAVAAERRVEELQAQLAAVDTNGHGDDEQVRRLQEELAASGTSGDERERAFQDAVARADSAEQLLSAAETRIAEAEARATQAESEARATARAAQAPSGAADPATEPADEDRVRELEIALADARAAAWDAEPQDEGPSLGVVETHAVPEDEDAGPQVPQELDEADAIRAELERMGQIVEHAGEAGDVEGLRGRLAKTAARKKGRSAAVDDRISRSS